MIGNLKLNLPSSNDSVDHPSGIDDTDESTFTISVDQKTFHFRATDSDDRDRWTRSLEETIYRPTNRILPS